LQVGQFVLVFFLPIFFTFTGLRTNLLGLGVDDLGWLAAILALAIGGKKMYAFRELGGDKWKTASKGVNLGPEEIVEIAKGGTVTYTPMVPTFSVHQSPRIVSRDVMATHKETPLPGEKISKKRKKKS
jgi:hypothetical protein